MTDDEKMNLFNEVHYALDIIDMSILSEERKEFLRFIVLKYGDLKIKELESK